jgi:eukaryotic-like serine/threonine-protein kinase
MQNRALPPTHIGRYTLQGELGRGGMAAVYRAYDPSFKRAVAVKVLPREFLHEANFRARFEREAQTIAKLEHSAIVPVYDYGEEDGQPYLVMRLMPGGSLADRIDRGPLSLQETIDLLSRLAPALDRAHALGIVHRDLKPANILFDADGDPYISDFGIAKLTQANTQLSQTGMMGTPAYMSPEQARGDKQIDGRADLYALGAMLYHMLSGQRPFESDTPMGMVLKHVTEPPPRVCLIRPDLPAACDAVIAKSMAKDPNQRFATAGEMLAALRSAQAARPAPPRPVPDPTARAVPATVRVDPGTVAAAPSAPGTPTAPSRHFPVLLLGLVGLGVLALAAVGVFIFTAISLYGPRAAGSATPLAQRSPTLPVVIALTGVPSRTPAPNSTLAPTRAALPTGTPAPTQSPAPAGTATPVVGATRLSSADKMMQMYVPAGPFTMGNDQGAADQRPAHTVSLDAFWIDRTEVTNAMFTLCVNAHACAAPQQFHSISRSSYFDNVKFADFPVLFVSWTQAQAYCAWAGRRLPTEAEWEKAARGTDGRLYPWGNQPPDPQRLNFGASALGDTVAVGQHPTGASPYGALDMAGNAWEWVADWYDPGYYAVSPPNNPPGPAKTGCPQGDCKVLRGGGWDSSAQDVTASARLFYGPNDTRDAFTIRCAQS